MLAALVGIAGVAPSTSASASAARDDARSVSAPAASAAPVLGPNPAWVRSDGRGSTAANAVVTPPGYTYLTSREVLYSAIGPGGVTSPATTPRSGPGTFAGATPDEPPAITFIPESSSSSESPVITGQITGSVTFREGQIGELTLDGGDGSSFLMQLSPDGTIRWARLFGDGSTASAFVRYSAGTIVVGGTLDAPLTLDGLPTTGAGAGDAFVAGFDPATGAARWVTEITTASSDVALEDLAADGDSVSWLGSIDGAVEVSGAGHEVGRTCAAAGYVACQVLADIDAATGRPLLVTVPSGDGRWTTDVALDADGFVLLAEDQTLPAPQPPSSALVTRLGTDGAEIWSRHLYGAESLGTGSDVAVDANGDVIVAVTFDQLVTLGDVAGSPFLANSQGGLALVEYAADGTLTRYVAGSGLGTDPGPTVTVGLDATDSIHLVADAAWPGPARFGTGPGAISVSGTGPLVATFLPDVSPPSTFSVTDPIRLLDSRTSTGGWNGKLRAGAPRHLDVTDRVSLPYETTAAVLNVTVTDVSAMTYVTAWPTGSPQPLVSNLNVVAGDTISNQVTVRLGDLGRVSFATAQGSAHVVVDLMGVYAATSWGFRHHSLAPTRLLDSRTTNGGWSSPLVAGGPRPLAVAGRNGIPADAAAVTLSVTATDTTNQTFVRVEPTSSASDSSSLNVNAGQTITNLVTVRVGDDGAVQFTNSVGSVALVVDAVGYYDDEADGSRFRPIVPTRVLDSRTGNGGYTTPWSAGAVRTVPVTAVAVGDDVMTGIAANLTATDTTAMSYATLYPGAPKPSTSNLLFTAGQTIAAAAQSGTGPGGTVSLFNQLGTAHLILDIGGYFTGP